MKIPAIGMTILLGAAPAAAQDGKPTFLEYLKKSAVKKEVLRDFIDPNVRTWAQYDPELGYILGKYMPRDGMDGSSTLSTAQKNGARTQQIYTEKPCRINTYGDSFTQCHQVSDAETWQEYLAGHLGEPVRNFGMGGYGVYQTYRRMLREEKKGHAANYILFYIYGDDHLRSLLRCRYALIWPWWNRTGPKMFHNNFWPNVDIDLETGKIREHDNMLPTAESLYKMADPDWMVEALKDDLALEMYVYVRGSIGSVNTAKIRNLARVLGVPAEGLEGSTPPVGAVRKVLDAYGFAATKYIVGKARDFAAAHGKKFMVILFDPSRSMNELVRTGTRYDQVIVDFLAKEKIRTFDMNVVHVEDFKKNFKVSFSQYRKRFFIGHYSPAGNHFFAYTLKNRLVDWLDPKPITYRGEKERLIDFEGYLEKE